MRREAQNVLLVLVGGALIKITLDGTYLRYVKPTVKPFVLTAGIVMVVLAFVAIARDIAASRPDRETIVGQGDHGHSHHRLWSPWLLMLPVLAIFLIAPPALGSDSVLRSAQSTSAVVQQGSAAFPPLPRGVVVPLPLSEFITRSVWDSTNSLNDRTIRLTGFIVHQNGSTYLARLVITCCAADATPMKIKLDSAVATRLANDQWVNADGVLRPGSATQANEYTPTVAVRALTLIPAPADPYEY